MVRLDKLRSASQPVCWLGAVAGGFCAAFIGPASATSNRVVAYLNIVGILWLLMSKHDARVHARRAPRRQPACDAGHQRNRRNDRSHGCAPKRLQLCSRRTAFMMETVRSHPTFCLTRCRRPAAVI